MLTPVRHSSERVRLFAPQVVRDRGDTIPERPVRGWIRLDDKQAPEQPLPNELQRWLDLSA